ncbi:small ribosomal subunit Rsm22 family protein [Aureimonas mangrovi]|uniref:small ribosomal subunit Rsm22 family protein n=1 Tax=Aureimonas mangrovi TaxID=2758041 RepID=UPI00163D50A3|nr:small ribosomal subunit Rsm22 family protein [Aureimonas mangrovi]
MDLPAHLRAAIDAALVATPLAALKTAGETLSSRYRAETRDGRLHLIDEVHAGAYVAARMPATFAAVRRAMEEVAIARSDFAPTRLLDVGSGPGTALWAACETWESIAEAECLEASEPIRAMAERLAADAFSFRPRFVSGDARRALDAARPADLVTLAYVLDELSPQEGARLVLDLWAKTTDTLLIVEPGTPAGWRRIITVRDALLREGAHVVAPCAHEKACPVGEPDWCHFAQRLARSRTHRQVKGGEAPFEDEKFCYLAVSREPPSAVRERVLAMPRTASGLVRLKLCTHGGMLEERVVTKREGATFKAARKSGWGDAW